MLILGKKGNFIYFHGTISFEVIFVYQKAVQKEDGYSKAQLAKIKRVFKKIEIARKDPEFMKAVRQFIKETT